MTVEDFERVLRSCVDDASGLNIADGRIRVEVRDEVIEANLDNSSGELHVVEDGNRVPATRWLTGRVARVQLLAARILAHVKEEPFFMDPSGSVLGWSGAARSREEKEISHVCETLLRSVKGGVDATTVHYLTSVPGGGMTTLINMAARVQAERFQRKEASWLLLPVSLRKRSFPGFDEIVSVELSSRLHYHLLYYGAVVELTRMGTIVPAFDGFEDMLTGQAGDATTVALGHLIGDLDSRGSLVIAARKAHFEYPEVEAQARLTQYLLEHKVKYVRTSLNLWSRRQFKDYAQRRGLHDGGTIHAKVEGCLGPDHPLVTRPAMASRVLDAAENGSLPGLLKDWRDCPSEYLRSLVEAVVTREAWAGSIFSVDEHHRLLARIAKQMWITSTNLFRRDYLEFIAKEFALECGKTEDAARQLGTQITRHPLVDTVGQRYGFVHDDFRKHYLGEALGQVLVSSADVPEDIADLMHKGSLSSRAADVAVSRARREGVEMVRVLALLQRVVDYAPLMSYTRESAGALALRCLELVYGEDPVELSGFVFPTDGLKGRRLEAVSFKECRFYGTSLMGAQIGGCRFIDCTMLGLEWPKGFVANGAVIRGGSVSAVLAAGGNRVCDPTEVAELLGQAGFRVEVPADTTAAGAVTPTVGADPSRMYGRSNLHEEEWRMERPVREDGSRSIHVEEVRDATEDKWDVPKDLRYALKSYGADMRVDTIVERMEMDEIVVPSFPGRPAWTAAQASRFVESLLLRLPVPGIFLFREPNAGALLVIDGHRRLRTLYDYCKGTFANGSKFRLSGVSTQFTGRGYRNLTANDRGELDDTLLHATIIEQVDPRDDRSAVYDVFERLNTGGAELKPQEIRASLYRGELNDLLSDLAANPSWRQLAVAGNSRKNHEEIILRCLALVYRAEEYERPMKFFLNRFMEENRDPTDERREEFRQVFMRAAGQIAEVLGPGALRPERGLNIAVTDATVVGLAHRLNRGPVLDRTELQAAHARLLSALNQEGLYRTGTTDEKRLGRRIELARALYGEVP